MAQFIYSPALTNFSVRAGVGTFQASKAIAPLKKVDAIIGQYSKRERFDTGNRDTKRALGESYKVTKTSDVNMIPYTCEDSGIIVPVPFEKVHGYGPSDLFQARANASVEALSIIEFHHASSVKDTIWAASEAGFNSIYGDANVNTPSTKWNASGNTIEKDIAAAKERVLINCGFAANVVAMTQTVFDAITTDPLSSVINRIKYTSGQNITKMALAAIFGVEEVIVFDELTQSANPGQTQSWGRLYSGNHVIVFRRDTALGNSVMSLVSTFYWELPGEPFMGVMERVNYEKKTYDQRSNGYLDIKLVAAEAGQVLYNVLT